MDQPAHWISYKGPPLLLLRMGFWWTASSHTLSSPSDLHNCYLPTLPNAGTTSFFISCPLSSTLLLLCNKSLKKLKCLKTITIYSVQQSMCWQVRLSSAGWFFWSAGFAYVPEVSYRSGWRFCWSCMHILSLWPQLGQLEWFLSPPLGMCSLIL